MYVVFKVQTLNGPVAQLVRAPPCHGGGREFESLLGRLYGIIAQLGEHLPYKQRVIGSSPIGPILQQEIVADFKIVQLQNVTDAGMPQWRNWQTHRT